MSTVAEGFARNPFNPVSIDGAPGRFARNGQTEPRVIQRVRAHQHGKELI